jgi:hypothetical protein
MVGMLVADGEGHAGDVSLDVSWGSYSEHSELSIAC